jgi:hypothetical protein
LYQAINVFFYSGKCRPSRNEYLPGLIYIQGWDIRPPADMFRDWDIRHGVRGRKQLRGSFAG